MYANIVVLTYGPPEIKTYTYEIPKNLEKLVMPGQLVQVPFGKRQPMGVVLSTHYRLPTTDYRIKPINSILLPISLLLPYQIELLKWLAFYYHAPMVNCLEAMMPDIPKRASGFRPALQGRTLHTEQTIVLVPSINRIPETLAKFPQAKNYIIYHNELATSQKFATWQKISSGTVDYVFGSRLAIFTPCPKLTEIIIYDEHEDSYKDERSPYYNTLTIAEKISELTGCKIKVIDNSPRITTYYLAKSTLARASAKRTTGLRPAEQGRVLYARNNLGGGKTKVKIVNMLDERRAGNKSPLSQVLEEYIRKGYVKNKKILLFLNKKTESGHVYCRNCKLADFASIQPNSCPNCQSPDIWFSSLNVQSLTSLVQKIVPSARISLLIRSDLARDSARSDLDGKGTIDIATAAVFYKLMPLKYDLVAHVQTDSVLNITQYQSAEKLFAQITNLKRITRGLLLLQTYNPDNTTITSAATDNYQKFFREQIEQRRALSYPPFVLLVKLAIIGKKGENLEEKAQKLYEELDQSIVNSHLSKDNEALSNVKLLGPYTPLFGGKTPKYNIILKLPVSGYSLKERTAARQLVRPLLLTVPKNWQIVVESDSII